MSTQNVWGEVALVRRIADLYDSGLDIPTACRMASRELEAYYRSHIGQEAVKFDLTEWVESQ